MQIKRLLIVIFLTLLSLFTVPVHSKDKEAEVTVQSLIDSRPEDQKIVAESVYENNDKLDIRFPGSDLANYPNSAFTLPQGGFYVEVAPEYSTDNSGSYSAGYLLRYGLLDRLELRLMSSGVQEQGGPGSTVVRALSSLNSYLPDIPRLSLKSLRSAPPTSTSNSAREEREQSRCWTCFHVSCSLLSPLFTNFVVYAGRAGCGILG